MIRRPPRSTLFPYNDALPISGQPIATQPIGYADLMDESSGNTQTLHVLVVGTTTDPPVTYLDNAVRDRKSTRLNSSHGYISYAVFCLKKKKQKNNQNTHLTKS